MYDVTYKISKYILLKKERGAREPLIDDKEYKRKEKDKTYNSEESAH